MFSHSLLWSALCRGLRLQFVILEHFLFSGQLMSLASLMPICDSLLIGQDIVGPAGDQW